ncbi:hypothetical protein JQC92_17430 [Shewanella sp. 202IG2-18]|uniref:hypothetical protein n=1 Tax=Parashewanella hymeniacidonis TaxID=2807618 RepID=UPI00195FD293|nr:hypothetical protein [Parashewanella hymeniacidonis]MBM7073795.1 hypothetical protein [Parashewanella hymeniacidonis]
MSTFTKFQTVILMILSLSLSACITLPGHRQTINEGNFHLQITSPDKATKHLIRFNSTKNEIIYLPEDTRIELIVIDAIGKHNLKIKKSINTIVYDYKLNGLKVVFDTEKIQWFESQVPRIASAIWL